MAIRTAPAKTGMPILLDTHAWVWWVTEDRRLSPGAAAAIRDAVRDNDVHLSVISIWEVAKKVEKKQLVLDRPLRQWVERATTVKGLALLELTPSILIDSCELPRPFHGDPADQMIVASARQHGGTLVTRDRRLRKYPHVQTVW
jgi:PIN domain nuclease of toxin-antitoxin system